MYCCYLIGTANINIPVIKTFPMRVVINILFVV